MSDGSPKDGVYSTLNDAEIVFETIIAPLLPRPGGDKDAGGVKKEIPAID